MNNPAPGSSSPSPPRESLAIPAWLRLLLAATSGLLLAAPFLDPRWYAAAWLGFAPVLIATTGLRLRAVYGLSLLTGFTFYLLSTYWLSHFFGIFKDYSPAISFLWSLVGWLYFAQLHALLITSYQWLRQTLNIPPLLAFPTLAVIFYALFPTLFPAQIGASQSHFVWALQGTSLVGVYGLDFVMALTNMALALWCIKRLGGGRVASWQLVATAVVVIGWLLGGGWSYQQWEARMAEWSELPLGLVQPNEAPSFGRPRIYPGYSRGYPPEMAMTEQLAQAGAELVFWPEARFKGYFSFPHVREAYQQHLQNHGVSLVFQDMELASRTATGRGRYYNSVVALDAQGQQAGHYRKVKRMPFGEKLPLIHDIPGLGRWLENYLGAFYQEILPGEKPTHFSLGSLKLVPLICYETIFSRYTASAVPTPAQGTVLVGLSSDGWFGRSRQPWQHTQISALRAVENRVPMVHVLNNGPSAIVLPNGRWLQTTPFDQAGGYLVSLPWSADSGGSFFSRHPHWFFIANWLLLGSCIVVSLVQTRERGRPVSHRL